MQHIELLLDHHDLYCPVTGQKIIGEFDEFKPSPAMVFCFVDEGESFEYARGGLQESFEKFMEETENDVYESYQKVVNGLDPEKTQNWVCFSIDNSSPFASIGPARLCFDMNYMKNKDN